MTRLWSVAILLVLATPGAAIAGRTGNEFRCTQISDICDHLSKKYGAAFSTGSLISEIEVPELTPFLSGVRFMLTNVSTSDPDFPAVDVLAVRSPVGDHTVASSVSPLFKDTDPAFLSIFQGIVVKEPSRRLDLARAIAKVLEEMTYAGSVTDVAADGPATVAVLRYKGKPVRRIRVVFDADGRADTVEVTAAQSVPKETPKGKSPARPLTDVRSVRELVRALADDGDLAGLNHARVLNGKQEGILTITRGPSGLTVEVSSCGGRRVMARDTTMDLAARYGLGVQAVAGEPCATDTLLGGDLKAEILAKIVATVCSDVFSMGKNDPVVVTQEP